MRASAGGASPRPPPRLPEFGWAHKDIKVARGNIVLWGMGDVEEGSPPPPPRPPHRRAQAA